MRTLVIALSLSLALASPATLAHRESAYSHDSNISDKNPGWMALLDNNIHISQLSMPGTHDSMSRYGGYIAATQALSLPAQLEAGIRVFDIRLRSIDNSFAIHNGPIFEHMMFGDVLNIMGDFLRQNPSEALFVRVKEEYHAQGSSILLSRSLTPTTTATGV